MTKQPPTSLRIPDQTKQRVHAYAAERGIPRNAAYVEILDRGLAMLRQPNSTTPITDRSGTKVQGKKLSEPFKSRLKGEWKAP